MKKFFLYFVVFVGFVAACTNNSGTQQPAPSEPDGVLAIIESEPNVSPDEQGTLVLFITDGCSKIVTTGTLTLRTTDDTRNVLFQSFSISELVTNSHGLPDPIIIRGLKSNHEYHLTLFFEGQSFSSPPLTTGYYVELVLLNQPCLHPPEERPPVNA